MKKQAVRTTVDIPVSLHRRLLLGDDLFAG